MILDENSELHLGGECFGTSQVYFKKQYQGWILVPSIWETLAPSRTLLGESLTYKGFPLPELQGNWRESTLIEYLVCARHWVNSRYIISSDLILTATSEVITTNNTVRKLQCISVTFHPLFDSERKAEQIPGLHRKPISEWRQSSWLPFRSNNEKTSSPKALNCDSCILCSQNKKMKLFPFH